MREPISILPSDLASQIAAGEVVERPASVVKELMENALDAQARRVDVSILGGGISSIEIADDGVGMARADAKLCLGRHATSKLRSFSDLDELSSYGFRGEALPSIASVSRLSIRTRCEEEDSGVLIEAEGTTKGKLAPVGHRVGTSLTVRDLFFNVPARRKFLKSSNTESGHVGEALVDAALARPDVSFTLKRDGKSVKNFPRASSRKGRVEQIFPSEKLISILGERGPLSVEGYLTGPSRSRQGAGGLKLIVNGRSIKDRALAGTIAHAYGGTLERGRFPKGALYLTLPARLLDVNVHPQKTEVRFADSRAVSDAVHSVVGKSVARAVAEMRLKEDGISVAPTGASRSATLSPRKGPTPRVVRDGAAPVSGQRYEPIPGTGSLPRLSPGPRKKPERSSGASISAASNSSASGRRSGTGEAWKGLRFLNQVRKTYLLCEGADALYIVDQHAADERVLFSRLKAGFDGSGVVSQSLLFPNVLSLSEVDRKLCRDRETELLSLGFDVRERSGDGVSLHAVPRLLPRVSPEELLPEVVQALKIGGSARALSTMACLGALQVGDTVLREEAEALLRSLNQADFEAECRHGDPIIETRSWTDLARKVPSRG